MAWCARCQKETELYEAGVPICVACLDESARKHGQELQAVEWPSSAVTGQDSFPGPSNDRELAIARAVDQIALEGRLKLISVHEVRNVIDFAPSVAESDFLLSYLRWRMAKPIVQ